MMDRSTDGEATMIPEREVVSELTRLVWSTMLGLDVEDRDAPGDDGEITTSVDIRGAWEGTVSITFDRALARRLAAAMFACAEGETTPAEVTDALGELVNMVGGNVKGLLPGPCQLSVPRVDDAPPAGGRAQWFDCGGQPFVVAVRERPRSRGED